jgi:hypothetical protein
MDETNKQGLWNRSCSNESIKEERLYGTIIMNDLQQGSIKINYITMN